MRGSIRPVGGAITPLALLAAWIGLVPRQYLPNPIEQPHISADVRALTKQFALSFWQALR